MAIFEPLPFEWNGVKYSIPDQDIPRLLAQVEDVLGPQELNVAVTQRRMPAWKTAIAFRMVLRSAGVVITDKEVYQAMIRAPGVMSQAFDFIVACYARMAPPEHMRDDQGKAEGGEAVDRTASSPPVTSSSSAVNHKP